MLVFLVRCQVLMPHMSSIRYRIPVVFVCFASNSPVRSCYLLVLLGKARHSDKRGDLIGHVSALLGGLETLF